METDPSYRIVHGRSHELGTRVTAIQAHSPSKAFKGLHGLGFRIWGAKMALGLEGHRSLGAMSFGGIFEASHTTQRLQCSSSLVLISFWLRRYTRLPKRELHSSLWVVNFGTLDNYICSMGVQEQSAGRSTRLLQGYGYGCRACEDLALYVLAAAGLLVLHTLDIRWPEDLMF